MAGIGVFPGYLTQARNANRTMASALTPTRTTNVGVIGRTAATKAALQPYLEGQLGISGATTPRTSLPRAFVQPVSIPNANKYVVPFTPAAAASSAATSGGGGGTTIDDLMAAIRADPMYGVAEQERTNALEMGERNLARDPIRQAAIATGIAPSAADLAGLSDEQRSLAQRWLDPATLQAASWNWDTPGGTGNIYSTAATIARSYNQARAAQGGNWAERGLVLGAGLAPGGMAIEASDLGYQRGAMDKQNLDTLLGTITGANKNWLEYQMEQDRIRRTAWENIASRLAQTRGPAPGEDTEDTDRGPYEGVEIPGPDYFPDIPGQNLNPFVPEQIYTPVHIGSETLYEPKPRAANYIPAPAPKKKTNAATSAAIKRARQASGAFSNALGW